MNRIWLEFDKPQSEEHAVEQCRLVNNMVRKLTDMGDWYFFYRLDIGYCYGNGMGHEVLLDNGKWLNLDKLGA